MASDNNLYHADTSRISKSGLDKIRKSPAHYYAHYLDKSETEADDEEEDSKALIVGGATHKLTFESDDFFSEYGFLNDASICEEIGGAQPRSTKRYKAWKEDFEAANASKRVLSSEDFHHSNKLATIFKEHPTVKILLQKGVAEERIDFTCPVTGVQCKIKPDWITWNDIIFDLKTTDDASREGFGKSMAKWRYHVQGAFYTDGFFQKYGRMPRAFVFGAIEKKKPHGIGLYKLTPQQYEKGRKLYLEDLAVYKKCLESGNWPSYTELIVDADMPAWSLKDI